MEEIKNIINDKAVGNTFFNLYDRWRDEEGYEDINDYGKAIVRRIASQFPSYNVKLIKATKKPFGVKISICDTTKAQLWVKINGRYVSLCAKQIR